MPKDQFTYDAVPYPSFTFPQTHPDRLSTLGAIGGVQTAPPERCRVLELGCGDGTNLLSFAYALPKSEFVGIDLSQVHITRAIETAAKLNVANTSFRQADVTDLDCGELGKFDFILAHGLFSWVPEGVRSHILRVYRECLAPNGIGYISYNAYPGCHIREITSGIMRFQADDFEDPVEKVDQGIAFLDLIGSAAEEGSLYQTILELEIEQIVDRSKQNVFHDDLSPINQPFYFHEFSSRLESIGMQFLSESDPSASNIGRLENRAQEVLDSLKGDVLRSEQFIDFITCRRFRSTLFCRSELEIDHDPVPEAIRSLFLSSQLVADAADPKIKDSSAVRFSGPKNAVVEINHPLTKAALTYLSRSSAKGTGFSGLVRHATEMIDTDNASIDDVAKTEAYFLQMYYAGFVHLRRYQPEFTTVVGTHPVASAFSRWQLENGSKSITMLTGANLTPESEVSRALITLLDGTRDRQQLESAMKDILEVPESQKAPFEAGLSGFIEEELNKFANAGLLIG